MSSSDGGEDRPTPRSGPRASYPAERSASARRRWFIALATAALIAGVVIAVLGYQRFADPEVSGETGSYEVITPGLVRVHYSVTRKDPSRPVACVVRARAYDGSEVGRREIIVAPSDHGQVSEIADVRTSREAFTGEVFGCTTNVPPYLDAQ